MSLRVCLAAWVLSCGPAAADQLFITLQQADSVAVVDAATGARLASISVPGHPAGIALSPDGTRAYVTSPDGPSLAVIDTVARRVVRTVPLPGAGPLGVTVSPDGASIYVADWYSKSVLNVNAETGAQMRRIEAGQSPSGLAVTPDGKLLAVAARLDDAVVLIDTDTGKIAGRVAVGAHPFGLTIDPAGKRAYTACVESDDVAVIDLAARRLVARIKVGRRPYVVALTPHRGYVTNELGGTVTPFDLATLVPGAPIKVGENPEGMEASKDFSRLYVANWMDDTLSIIDAASGAATRTVKVGDSPRAFGTFVK